MIINHLVAISLLVMSVVTTADLFIKQDKKLTKIVKNFEIYTKNLHEKKE